MRTVFNRENDKWVRPWEIEKFDNLSIRDERFFSILIKGCLGWLTRHITMYNKSIKHFILSTGSSYMYVEANGYYNSWVETSGEDWMYMECPRCIVNLQEISIPTEELTNPFIRGNYERYSEDGQVKGYNAEMRRLPIEMTLNLQYVLNNFNESIILIQELFDKLVFQRYFKITYLGQLIQCSIEFPNGANLPQKKIDLSSTDDSHRTIEISIKLNSTYPIINTDTEIPASLVIGGFGFSVASSENGTPLEDLGDKNI